MEKKEKPLSLLPCSCGESDRVSVRLFDGTDLQQVSCPSCGRAGPWMSSLFLAVATWNVIVDLKWPAHAVAPEVSRSEKSDAYNEVWLIEKTDQWGSIWWWDSAGWTKVAEGGIRFVRQEDAARVISSYEFEGCRPKAHIFLGG